MKSKLIYYKSLPRIFFVYLKDKMLLKKPVAILMYHSVSENPEFFCVSPENFGWQMEYLYKNKYNIVSLEELVDKLKNKEELKRKTVVLTFDDGYEDNYIKVFPILKKYSFPATIFLTTGRVGNKDYMNKRGIKLPMLDWGQIEEMHRSALIDFEPHTVSHPRLSEISIKEAEKEITQSKAEIERKLNKKCQVFAYPYGDFNEEVSRLADGEFRALTTVGLGFVGLSDKPKELKRNSIDCLTGHLSFKLKI